MKIICIGRNYVAHVTELENKLPEEPLFFLKPDSAIVQHNRPFFIPDFSKEIHYEIEVLVRISKLGKYIQEKYAHTYYNEIGLGVDFTARDLQRKCIEEGNPWEISKSFDHSAVISRFLPKDRFKNIGDIRFSLCKNGEMVQEGNTGDMIFPIDTIISYVSRFMTLKIGDIVYTGTPSGVGPVAVNDRLEGYLEDQKLLDFRIK